MQENYLIILVIAGLVDIFSCSVVGDNIPTVSVNSSCNVIKSSLFQLDLNCINNLGSENIRNISASTSKYCSSYYHCEYDAFYWDRSKRCIAFSYDVLKLCPLLLVSDQTPLLNSMLFLHVTPTMPSTVKQLLISHNYRYAIAQMLDCLDQKYLCDDFTCVDWRLRCDGISQCPDRSDEASCAGNGKCIGRDGKTYAAGQEYAPYAESDGCKICVCGSYGTPSYCYSPLCTASVSCSGSSPDICCKCFDDPYSQSEPSMFSYTQRLLISCVAVLVIIALILIFSRSFSQHSLRRRPNPRMSDPTWIGMVSRDLPPNRSFFFEHNSGRPCGIDFFDRNIVPDVPPPYTQAKPEAQETVDAPAPPPSYEDITANAEQTDDVPSSPTRHEGENPTSGPVSPLSTTSACPLLRNSTESSS